MLIVCLEEVHSPYRWRSHGKENLVEPSLPRTKKQRAKEETACLVVVDGIKPAP
jgi:hypothetical protein